MNFELTLNKMAKKHGFEFSWQELKFGTRRAVIKCDSWNQLGYIKDVCNRVSGLTIDSCAITGGGVFDGYVYVMTAEESSELRNKMAAAANTINEWWERYHIADAETRRLMACGAIA